MAKIINNKMLRSLIELATSAEQADEIIVRYKHYQTIPEKIAFLEGMFDVLICDEHPGDRENEDIYKMLLHAIVTAKYK